MCFAPQRRALFRHLNLQKWSEPRQKWSHHGVLCTFSLGNVLRATTAGNFSSLIWPAGSAPAALALLFDPPEPQIIGKTQCFATPFRASASSFFLLFLFYSSFRLPLLSASSLLCFSSVHIVGSLTSQTSFDNLLMALMMISNKRKCPACLAPHEGMQYWTRVSGGYINWVMHCYRQMMTTWQEPSHTWCLVFRTSSNMVVHLVCEILSFAE